MTKKERVDLLLELMDKEYPEVKCSLNYSNPLEMLIATQLSAQCTDARVNIVTEELFKRYKTAEDYANADITEIQEYIRSAGFYKSVYRPENKCKAGCRSSRIVQSGFKINQNKRFVQGRCKICSGTCRL